MTQPTHRWVQADLPGSTDSRARDRGTPLKWFEATCRRESNWGYLSVQVDTTELSPGAGVRATKTSAPTSDITWIHTRCVSDSRSDGLLTSTNHACIVSERQSMMSGSRRSACCSRTPGPTVPERLLPR